MNNLTIFPTFQCNSRCKFCLEQKRRNHHKKHKFTTQELKENIQKLARKQGETKLTLSGGEPTIASNLFELLDFAKEEGVNSFEIQTNARMLSYESMVKKFKEYEPIIFLVSQHFPDKKLYKKYTLVDGFGQAMQGIKNLVKYNIDLTLNTLVLKQNFDYLENTIDLFIEAGVKKMQLEQMDGTDWPGNFKKFALPYSQCVPEIQKIIKKKSNRIEISLYDFPPCVLEKKFHKNLAPLPKKRAILSPDGSLASEEKVNKQKLIYPNKICKRCPYRKMCNGVRKRYVKEYGSKEFTPKKINKK